MTRDKPRGQHGGHDAPGELGERRLAVMTNWAFFGSFGLCFALSGFSEADLLAGLFGFALLAAAFGAHVIINHLFRTRFSKGEVALGLTAFIFSVLGFVLSWLLLPHFDTANIAIGLAGFSLLFSCFLFYLVAHHGVRGSIDMFDRVRRR